MNVRSAVSSRPALQRFFARTDFVPSKTSISRRSRPGSAAPFKDSRPDTLAFVLSTLNTNGTRSLNAVIYCYSNTEALQTDISGFVNKQKIVAVLKRHAIKAGFIV